MASLIILAVTLTGAGAWVYVDQIAPKPAPVIQTAPSEQSEAKKQPQINDETANRQTYQNFTGEYLFRDPENEYSGTLLVEQLSEKEINFALSVNMGAPGYNSGTIYKTKLFLNDNAAIYENNEYGDCKFKIIFNDKKAIIEYISELPNSGFNCGFGYGVYVNGSYPKTDSNTPDFEKNGPRIN